MKKCAEPIKIISVIAAIIASYFLLILRWRFLSPLIQNILDFSSKLWGIVEFGTAALCICVPVMIVFRLLEAKYQYILFTIPVIFLLVLFYSPEGLYLIIFKGPWFLTPAEPDWKYGVYISIMFFIIDSIAYLIEMSFRMCREENFDSQKNKSDLN